VAVRLALDCYVEEIPDYGIESFVESWADAGIERLRPTIAYHPVRIFSPANPRRRLLDLEGDVCFLAASRADSFQGALRPVFSQRSPGVLESIAEACRAHSIALDGWLVTLNNWTLATRHPDVAVQSALGSPDCTWLSPAHPETMRYVVGLVRAAGSSGLVDELQVEALYHVPFPCHPCERAGIGIELSPLDLWLAGVCVSEHSLALVAECGGDSERVTRTLAAHFDGRVRGEGRSLPRTREAAAEVLGADAESVFRGRELAVTRLADAAAAEAERHGLKLEFEDDLASWESFFTGVMEGPLSGERQWEVGTDRKALASTLDDYLLLLYFADKERLKAEIESCAGAIGRAPRAGIRPYPPDCGSADDLAETLALLDRLGVEEVMLYMQSLMPVGTQHLVREATDRLRAGQP
jgi:hypothetical protein